MIQNFDLIRYCQDEKYRQETISAARHDLAIKFIKARIRVKANKARNGGIYVAEN